MNRIGLMRLLLDFVGSVHMISISCDAALGGPPMLRFHTATSSYGVKKYFEASDYYAAESVGVWGGRLCAELGVEPGSRVEKDDFDRLCDNRRPDGRRLTPRTNDNRRVGEDMIFSLPKDVGAFIMLLPPQEREAYLAMVERRVVEVMNVIEGDVETRVRKGGAFENRPGDGLIWAGHRHTTSRPVDGQPPDPHPHWHMFCFNATRDGGEGGRVKAADFANIYRDKAYYEALFFSLVAGDFARLGHAVESREGGRWGLAGLRFLGDIFSKRTDEIEAEAARLRINDPDRKGELGAKTRNKKDKELPEDQLRQSWWGQLSDGQRDAVALARARQIAPDRAVTAAQAAAYAVAHAFEREAVVSERELVGTALLYGLGDVAADEVRAQLAGHGVLLAEKDGRLMASTREAWARERFLVTFASAGRGVVAPAGVPGELQRGILDDEQWQAVQALLSSCDRVQMVDSAAGVGKSTMLSVYDRGMTLAGKHVTYLATTTPAVDVLRRDGFAAESLAKFLLSETMQHEARGGTVVVDESSMMGLKDAYKLFCIAKEKEIKLVLLGDSRQHSSVAAGAVMRTLHQYGRVTPIRITQIKRQHNEDHRRAVGLLFEGRVLDAFDILDRKLGWVHEIADAGERYKAMASAYVDALNSGVKWDEILLSSPTHAEGERMVDHARLLLRAEGLIGGQDHEFTRWVSADLTEAQRGDTRNYRPGGVDMVQFFQRARGHAPGTRVMIGQEGAAGLPLDQAAKFQAFRKETVSFAAGDIIRFTAGGMTVDGHQIRNGARYRIAGFTATGIRLENGWLVSKDFGHFKHGIETSHGAQSKTVKLSISGIASQSFGAANSQQEYVDASRARYQALTFTDDKEALRRAIQRSSLKMAAHDLFPAPAPPAADEAEGRSRYRQWRDRLWKRLAALGRCRRDAEAAAARPRPEPPRPPLTHAERYAAEHRRGAAHGRG